MTDHEPDTDDSTDRDIELELEDITDLEHGAKQIMYDVRRADGETVLDPLHPDQIPMDSVQFHYKLRIVIGEEREPLPHASEVFEGGVDLDTSAIHVRDPFDSDFAVGERVTGAEAFARITPTMLEAINEALKGIRDAIDSAFFDGEPVDTGATKPDVPDDEDVIDDYEDIDGNPYLVDQPDDDDDTIPLEWGGEGDYPGDGGDDE